MRREKRHVECAIQHVQIETRSDLDAELENDVIAEDDATGRLFKANGVARNDPIPVLFNPVELPSTLEFTSLDFDGYGKSPLSRTRLSGFFWKKNGSSRSGS